MSFFNIHHFRPGAQAGLKWSQTFYQMKISLLVSRGRFQGLEFYLGRVFPTAYWSDALSEFIQIQQVFLISGHQPFDAFFQPGLLLPQVLCTPLDRISLLR